MKDNLKILITASEGLPFAKTGGLADVMGALPGQLNQLGAEVIVVYPYYKVVKNAVGISETFAHIWVKSDQNHYRFKVFRSDASDGVKYFFLENEQFFDRDELYGLKGIDFQDNLIRYAAFSKGVLKLCQLLDFTPDIIHCHDWQTALIPLYLKYADSPLFESTKTVLTIHNLSYQGIFNFDQFPQLDLPLETYQVEGLEYYGKINLLKGGIIWADYVTTVSKKYSEEIQTEEFGCGLEGVLKKRSLALTGILNGIDYTIWNPETDKFIPATYNIANIDGKKKCRKELLKVFSLDIKETTPVVGMISRLVHQKGFDILAKSIDNILSLDLGLVILGTGLEEFHKFFKGIANDYKDKFGLYLGFNEELAHKIEAGADYFLMPSRFEPCGLNQIYSLKYGTVPIVRDIGGLSDTIERFDPNTLTGNGFLFQEYSHKALFHTVKEAISLFNNKKIFNRLVRNGMSADFSWEKTAKEYEALFQKVIAHNIVSN